MGVDWILPESVHNSTSWEDGAGEVKKLKSYNKEVFSLENKMLKF